MTDLIELGPQRAKRDAELLFFVVKEESPAIRAIATAVAALRSKGLPEAEILKFDRGARASLRVVK